MARNNDWGNEAEQIACDYLVAQGYAIRENNYRSGNGRRREVDLIAQHGKVIVFVEVKARSGNAEDPIDAVDGKKIRMMVRTADAYMQDLEDDFSHRYDIIAITGTPDSYTIEHIPDAFYSPLFTR
ncbi:MAG: YraN family protein [Muribaculaceae bacterium]|nr:YraN family protein [Bacteroides sp.]MDE7496124.1 YraN family protein [Muribaculaceae bacterium]